MSTPLATADRALYAERCRVVDLEKRLAASEARAEKAISDTVQEFGLRRAAEARVAEVESKFTVVDNLRTSADRALYAERVRVVGLEARVRALEAGIKAAMDYSGNRWSEWGERAENVGDMLGALLNPPPEAEKKGDNDGR